MIPNQFENPSISAPTHRKKEEKGKNSRRQKSNEQLMLIKKALAVLLKPSCPRPSNTGSARSFHRDTERERKVLRYCEVLQLCGSQLYRCATKVLRVTHTGTYGTVRAR